MLGSLLVMQEPDVRPEDAGGPGQGIDQLAFLVGGTWVARPACTTTVAETCTWGLGKAVIFTKVEQKIDGRVGATAYGVFSYDPMAKVLRSHSVSSRGTAQSAVEVESNASTWIFKSTLVGSPAEQKRVTMKQVSADEMTVASAPWSGGTPPLTLTYRREDGPP